ncbi:hypothetical protein [Bacillus sp. FJAT-45350]|uniref:hypothetical protein n=1 Tax=Bacillus sp. FJAT-45350 TaxID=2011014 RepID=UPI000BB6F055|nr:hypothetical protein [Bacillus sp. FJAT-45350]
MNFVKVSVALSIMILFLLGCSEKHISFEERIQQKIQNASSESIIHYEVKDNYVYVFYTDHEMLRYQAFKLSGSTVEWVDGSGGSDIINGGFSASNNYDLPFSFSYFTSNNPDVENVLVHGQQAKYIRINDTISFWVAFTETPFERGDFVALSNEGEEVDLVIFE